MTMYLASLWRTHGIKITRILLAYSESSHSYQKESVSHVSVQQTAVHKCDLSHTAWIAIHDTLISLAPLTDELAW